MAKNLIDFRTQLDAVLKDDAQLLSQSEKDGFIEKAMEDYSRDRPLKKKTDFEGDGNTFDIPVPDGWLPEFSSIESIEYPANLRDPNFLDDDDYFIYKNTDGSYVIRLRQFTPQVGEIARIEYTIPHTQPGDPAATSAPDPDFYAICDRAAYNAFLSMAAKQTQTSSPGQLADVVNFQESANNYRSLATAMIKRYRERLGLDQETQTRAASGTVGLDVELESGIDRVTHPRRGRW